MLGGRGRRGSGSLLGPADADAAGDDDLLHLYGSARVQALKAGPLVHLGVATEGSARLLGAQEGNGTHDVQLPESVLQVIGLAIHGTLGAVVAHLLASLVHCEVALREQGVDVGGDNAVHGLLSHYGVASDLAVAVVGVLHVGHQVLKGLVPGERLAPAAVLLLQGGLGDLPALVVAADKVLAGHADVVHEDAVLAAAAQKLHPADLQTVGRVLDQEEAQVAVARRVGVGHHWAEENVGYACAADKLLLTGDDPVVAVAGRTALEACQV